MSSDLLQQAIIDAAALKEVAIKNAQNALIEKYSHEFNNTVQKLLEQEEVATQPATLNATPPPTTDVSPAGGGSTPEQETPDLSAAALDPTSSNGVSGLENNKDSAFSKVPDSFSDSDEDEMITINFDQIRSTLNEMLGYQEEASDLLSQNPDSDALAAGAADPTVDGSGEKERVDVVIKINDEEELEEITDSDSPPQLEEIELEEDAAAIATREAAGYQLLGDAAKQRAADARKTGKEQTISTMEPNLEEEVELTEEELAELEESLRIDLKVGNLSDGYMGSTETQKREQRNVELAAARDEKATEERAAELEKMKDLMQENKKLKSLNSDALQSLSALKEQLEKMNLINAKLLYTNKALGNISLNERQKNQIVESLSKADSVLEAKTIYETLQNAVENMSKDKEAPQSLRETLNRAATPFAVKKSANNSINDLMADRMKALAGIKK